MNILIVLDALTSGGAQKLKLELAKGLIKREHTVELFIYDQNNAFFKSDFINAGIKINTVNRKEKGFSFRVLKELRKTIRNSNFDFVISSLHAPGIYSALALIGIKKKKLIICEESSSLAPVSFLKKLLFYFSTLLADFVVANSFHEAKLMKKLPGRTSKLRSIWNGFELSSITYKKKGNFNKDDKSKLLVVGRVAYPKNGLNFLRALNLFLERNGWIPEINWVGRRDTDKRSMKDKKSAKIQEEIDSYLESNEAISRKWNWLGNVKEVEKYYHSADALIHVSLYEGLPLVICEAMLSGCFVIASDVCDHPLLIGKSERGILCDPNSPQSICEAIEKFYSMDDSALSKSVSEARQFSVKHFDRDIMVDRFEELFKNKKKVNHA